MGKNNKSSREKTERDLLEDIKRLLILSITKGEATQEEVGKCLGVSNKQINNILMGVGKNKKNE